MLSISEIGLAVIESVSSAGLCGSRGSGTYSVFDEGGGAEVGAPLVLVHMRILMFAKVLTREEKIPGNMPPRYLFDLVSPISLNLQLS